MPDADSVTVLGDLREGVGTRIAVRTRLFGVPAFTEILEVTNWHPGVGLEVRHGGPVRGFGRWRLRPAGDGAEFLWEEEFRLAFGGPLGELAAVVYAPLLRWLIRRAINGLTGRLRTGPPG